MSEKSSQSSPANTSVYLSKAPGRSWRVAATVFGLFVLVYGAADISSRVAHAAFGHDASLFAFGPVVALVQHASTTPAAAVHATSTPITAAQAGAGITPSRLIIPSIGVNANVEQVGLKDNGSMDTPKTFGDVAWYSLGSKPGAAGNAVIDGHVNNALTTAGVFMHLSQIALGDKIQLTNASGTVVTFQVSNIEEYPVDSAPAASIFATAGPSQLVLITCDGVWVPSEKSFDKRLVVFASKV